MANFTRKTFNFTDETILMIEELKTMKGFPDDVDVVRSAIADVYNREMRNEKRVKKAGDVDDKLDVDERRRAREVERCKKIAERLEGELVAAGDGFNVVYHTHSKHGSFRQVVPLLGLTEELVQKQWFPNRKMVEEYWELNGKTPDKK